MKRLSLTRRQRIPGALLALRRTRKRRALRDDTEQRKPIDRLQILRLPDPPIEALKQEGETQAKQQAPRPLLSGGLLGFVNKGR
jgi:hypothetical protein